MMLVLSDLPLLYPSRAYPIRRAFHFWYLAEQHRFRVPLRFSVGPDSAIHFRFLGAEHSLRGLVDETGLRVFAIWNQEDFCLLRPSQFADGHTTTTALRVAVPWEFEPFLGWVNAMLAPATAVAFIENGSGRGAFLLPASQHLSVDGARQASIHPGLASTPAA